MVEKEWSESPGDDPIELQKKQLALGKEFLRRIEEQEEKERKQACQPAAYGAIAPAYTPPTFEQTSERIKKAWEEVKQIVPDAPDQVKVQAFQALMRIAAFGGME